MANKTCWIIGASFGIGESLVRKFFENGYDVAISARSKDKLEKIASQLKSKNIAENKIIVVECDVGNYESFQKAQNQILEKFNKIDLAIFAPALYEIMNIFDFDIKKAHQITEINLNGTLSFLHLIVPQMVKQKSGQIALIASVAGYVGLPNSLAYGASKAGMINLGEGIYNQLASKNINLSIINPGFVDTRLTKKNNFKMPFIISQDDAANEIYQGLLKKKFEIHFPKKFTFFIKLLKLIPYKLYFALTKKIT